MNHSSTGTGEGATTAAEAAQLPAAAADSDAMTVTAAPERRRQPRTAGSRPVEVLLLPGGASFPGTIVDLSRGGIGLRAKRPIPAGREFRLLFHGGTGDGGDLAVVYRSVRCSRGAADGFRVGATLVRRLT